jgi:VWFA-related protein
LIVRAALPLVLAALLGSVQAAHAQQPSPSPAPAEPTPTFTAGTELVTVDAVVVDKQGKPVTGMSQADFQLFEDGKPQKIVSFEAVMLPEQPLTGPAPEKPRVSSNLEPENRLGRTFMLVFDDIHMSPGQAERAKAAIAEFLRTGVREGDRVSLVSTSGSAWWSTRMTAGRQEILEMIKRLDGRLIPDRSPDRVTEYEAMRIHVYRDPQVAATVSRRLQQMNTSQSQQYIRPEDDPLVRNRSTEVYWQSVARNRITLQILERVLQSLAATKGRKSLILASEGFIYDPNLDEFKKVVQASRRSNVAIFFLDTKGLGGLPPWMGAENRAGISEQDVGPSFNEAFEASAGAESIAADSGGFTVKNTNDFARGMQRIADETRVYYLLGYQPANTAADGRFRKIEVKSTRKGVKVRARKGYFAPLPAGTAPKKEDQRADPDIQAALDSPYELNKVPVRMTAWVFDETLLNRASTVVAAEVDVRNMAFRDEEGRSVDAAEFLMVVAHRETGEHFRYDQRIEMKLSPETRKRLEASWLPILRDFELAPGGYQAKIVVRDANSKAIGTVVHEFEIPPLDKLRVSTPILSDTLARNEEGAAPTTPRPALHARRTFAPGSTLLCQFEVYAAKKNAKGMPEVTAGYVIRRAGGGEEIARVAPSQIKPTSLGKLSRLVGTPLPPDVTGDLELVLDVKDELAGQTIQVREPFRVEAGAPPAPAPAAAP